MAGYGPQFADQLEGVDRLSILIAEFGALQPAFCTSSHKPVRHPERRLSFDSCGQEHRTFLENPMSIADDLIRLEQLRDRASLSADEFQRAKNKLLNTPYPTEPVLQAINGLHRSATDRWL